MPLNGGHIGFALQTDGLGYFVMGAVGLYFKIGSQVFDALVVNAIDLGRLSAAKQLGQLSVGYKLHIMKIVVIQVCVAMHKSFWPLCGNVLVQGATKSNIDNLKSAANAQNWLSRFHKRLNQTLVVLIADAVTFPARV